MLLKSKLVDKKFTDTAGVVRLSLIKLVLISEHRGAA